MGQRRKQKFLKALITSREIIKSEVKTNLQVRPEVEQVIFVMHGIRDWGHWRHKIINCILEISRNESKIIEAIQSGYGYFPMLRFLLFGERQKNVRWFMDRYTEAIAKYPKAEIHFIGHSNGTYLLASALKSYQACKFNRVVFAGSVVPTNFHWDTYVAGRVEKVQNYVAAG